MKKATGQAAVVGVGGNRKGKQQKANEGRRKEEKGKQVGRVAPLRVVLSPNSVTMRLHLATFFTSWWSLVQSSSNPRMLWRASGIVDNLL